MDSFIQDIKDVLNSPSGLGDSAELLDADVYQIKDSIRSSINNHIYQLRVREQWLLQHLDQMYECFSSMLQGDKDKLTELRGKLQCCADASLFSELENRPSFRSYGLGIMGAFKRLNAQERRYEPGSITFLDDGGQLLRNIHQFGKLTNVNTHLSDEGSERSWEFPESETMSAASENEDVSFLKDCNSCPGGVLEIEEINKHFEKISQTPIVSLSDVCQRDDVCNSVQDCICETPCYDFPQISPYVAQVTQAFDVICGRKESEIKESAEVHDVYADVDCSDVCNDPAEPFRRHVSSLEAQFAQIISGGTTIQPYQESGKLLSSHSSFSIESLAKEIEKISSGVATSASRSTPTPVLNLMSEISAITQGKAFSEVELYSYDPTCAWKTVHYSEDSRVAEVSKLGLEKIDPEMKFVDLRDFKSQQSVDGKDADALEQAYCIKNDGWSTVEEVHDLLTGILSS